MPTPPVDVDVDELVRRYSLGGSIGDAAQAVGCTRNVARRRLISAGVALRNNRRDELDADEIARRYRAGESELAIARSLGVSRLAIRPRLIAAGVEIRGRGAAMEQRMANNTPEQRKAWAEAAHAAVRGKRPSAEALAASARARSRLVGKGEEWLTDRLRERGFVVEQQLPVGPYNLDLAVDQVAVEVHRSTGHPLRITKFRQRTVYLNERGWAVLYVWLNWQRPRLAKITPTGLDEIVAHLELARRNPAAVRQQRVIRGTGEESP